MAVNIPPGPDVAQKPQLLGPTQSSPDRVAVRPQAIDCSTPAYRRSAIEQPAPQSLQRALRNFLQLYRCNAMVGMSARRQAATRQGGDPATKPRFIQAQHHVDHGKAGADQQHVAAACGRLCYGLAAGSAPGIVDEQP